MVAGQEFFGVEQWGQLEVLWWKLAELIDAVASDGAAETYFDDSSIHFAMQRTDADNVQLGWHSDVFHNGSSVNVQLRPLRAEFARAGLEFCAWMESGEATDLSRDLRTRLESWTT